MRAHVENVDDCLPKVYHSMRIRGRCCGCFPDVVDIIGEVTARVRNSTGMEAIETRLRQ